METLKELKKQILKKMSKEELDKKYTALVEKNEIFIKNKRMAHYYIAREAGIDLQSNVATSSREAFPLSIAESRTDEKKNFNLSGYVIGNITPFMNSKGDQQAFVQIADNTDTISISVFADQLPQFEDYDHGDYVVLSNLYWKDKTIYNPSYGQFSSVTKAEAPFGMNEVVLNKIAELIEGKYYAIKGIIVSIPDQSLMTPLHCSGGHWFTGLEDSAVGTDIKCEKCKDIMEVEQHTIVSGAWFADEDKEVQIDIGTFAGLDSIEILDELILRGRFEDGVLKANFAMPVKKN